MTLDTTVRSEKGWRRFVRPAAEEFTDLVCGLGSPGNHFVILQRIPDLPDYFAQTWHEDGGEYIVEHRDGGPDRHFRALVSGPEEAVAVLLAWARREDAWDAGLQWQSLDLPPAEPVPPLELSAEDARLLEDRVRLAVVAGYDDRDRIAELAEEHLVDGDRRPVSGPQARALADRLWLERVAEQTAWDGETDPERLTRAFRSLDGAGITAREDFACCRSCGQAEIGAAGAEDARGFVYFHGQCAESAAAGHGLTLLYGGFDGSEATTASVGREVVAALEEAGLNVVWDGDPSRAIDVTPLDWRKRLVG